MIIIDQVCVIYYQHLSKVWCSTIENKMKWNEIKWDEMKSSELNWIELNWIELNWIELNWIDDLDDDVFVFELSMCKKTTDTIHQAREGRWLQIDSDSSGIQR